MLCICIMCILMHVMHMRNVRIDSYIYGDACLNTRAGVILEGHLGEKSP